MHQTEENKPLMPALLSTNQAAAYLSVSRDTVRRLAVFGHLPVVKFARGWRFHRKDIDTYIERCKITL